jgi:uroporphyrinogen-III synthase
MRVLVTRPEPEASLSAAALRRLGHDPIAAPVLDIVLDRAVAIDPAGLQAIAVTSVNAVKALAERGLGSLPLYAVGDATAAAARAAGFSIVISAGGRAGDLVEAVRCGCVPTQGAILYAAGRDRSGDVDGDLRRAGFTVRLVEVYRAEPVRALAAEAVAALGEGAVDAALVFSRRSGEILVSRLTELQMPHIPVHLAVAAISEAAAEPFRRAGFARIRVAARPTADALYEALDRND